MPVRMRQPMPPAAQRALRQAGSRDGWCGARARACRRACPARGRAGSAGGWAGGWARAAPRPANAPGPRLPPPAPGPGLAAAESPPLPRASRPEPIAAGLSWCVSMTTCSAYK